MFINELNCYIYILCMIVFILKAVFNTDTSKKWLYLLLVAYSGIIAGNNYNQYNEVQKAVSLELAEFKGDKLIWLSEDLKRLKGPKN